MNLEQIAEKYAEAWEHDTQHGKVYEDRETFKSLLLSAVEKAYNLGKQESTQSAIKEAVREELTRNLDLLIDKNKELGKKYRGALESDPDMSQNYYGQIQVINGFIYTFKSRLSELSTDLNK